MNAFHRQSIGVAFRHIDDRLAQIEAILQSVGGRSPFSGYAFDIGPAEQRGIAGYLQRLRERMWAAMQRLEIPADQRRVSAAWVIKTTLLDVSITLAEIEPGRLIGYGELDDHSATILSGILSDLDRLTNSLDAYLSRIQGGDVAARMARLETTPANREAVATIEEVIGRQGLVELRPILDGILARLASRDLEIAVFGRVSSGKSSLLNHLLGCDVLPVGVLPVTAVLTRLRRCDSPSAIVRTEISPPREAAFDQIAEYVTEERNSRNSKRVVDVTVGFPSDRLSDGVLLIDTPGVGSLATVGAAQTKAYLPRCDLGVVLVGAGSALDQEDLALLAATQESLIPSMVLISKADLLGEHDRGRVLEYVRRQTREALGSEARVFLVSTRGNDAGLTDRWFDAEIRPIMARHQEELDRSIRRKIGNLVELAVSLLQARIDRSQVSADRPGAQRVAEGRQLLREVEDRTAELAGVLTRPIDEGITETVRGLIELTATEVVRRRRHNESADGTLRVLATTLLADESEQARTRVEDFGSFLRQSSERLADLLGITNPRAVEDQDWAVRPMPPADERGLLELSTASCPRPFRLWRSMARRILQRRMLAESEAKLWSLIRDHRYKLRHWTELGLRRLTNTFEAQTAPARARLESARGPGSDGADGQQVVTDINALRRVLMPLDSTPAPSPGPHEMTCAPGATT